MVSDRMIVDDRSAVSSRGTQGLRRLTLAEPNVRVIEGNVLDVIDEAGAVRGVRYTTKDNEAVQSVRAPLTFIIDGLGSKFRKRMIDVNVQSNSYFTGCLVENCAAIDKNFAEVILTPKAPVLLYPILDGVHRTSSSSYSINLPIITIPWQAFLLTSPRHCLISLTDH